MATTSNASTTGGPVKQFVWRLCLCAHQLDNGRLPREPPSYLPDRAERCVRERLMPTDAFIALQHVGDRELAASFGAPIARVAARRHDLDQLTPIVALARGASRQ